MSIPVELDALDEQVERFGPRALLVTTGAEGPPHIASVLVSVERSELTMGAGRKTRANVVDRSAVSLVWTAPHEDEYCLIVDGTARIDASDAFFVTPASAILHRLAVPRADGS